MISLESQWVVVDVGGSRRSEHCRLQQQQVDASLVTVGTVSDVYRRLQPQVCVARPMMCVLAVWAPQAQGQVLIYSSLDALAPQALAHAVPDRLVNTACGCTYTGAVLHFTLQDGNPPAAFLCIMATCCHTVQKLLLDSTTSRPTPCSGLQVHTPRNSTPATTICATVG